MYVLQQIRAVAAATPGKLALVYNGAPVTHSAFWRYIAACREALAPQLPGEGLAIVWVDNLFDTWVLNLALKSLGLDTVSLRTRDEVIEQAGLGAACIVTVESEAGHGLPRLPGLIQLALPPPSRRPLDLAAPLPPMPAIPRIGKHMTLTSGTTGHYKRVLRDFGGEAGTILGRVARHTADGFRPLNADMLLHAFDLGLWSGGGHSWPLLAWGLGGGVVLDQSGRPSHGLDWPGITHAVGNPWVLQQLMGEPQGAFPFQPDLQMIVQAGAVSTVLAREVRRRLTPHLMITLSSTEAGGWAQTLARTDEELRWYTLHAERRVEIVDDDGVVLPVGQLGRVRVSLRADNARSYVGDDETSARVFSDGWFYPGDIGVLDGAGRIAVLGRVTDILNINGEKYPAEPWERAIQERLGCEAVCVLNGDWDGSGERLCVFLESRRQLPAADIAAALRDTLAGFAQAEAYVVAALPRTPNGKVKRLDLAQQLRDGAYKAGARY